MGCIYRFLGEVAYIEMRESHPSQKSPGSSLPHLPPANYGCFLPGFCLEIVSCKRNATVCTACGVWRLLFFVTHLRFLHTSACSLAGPLSIAETTPCYRGLFIHSPCSGVFLFYLACFHYQYDFDDFDEATCLCTCHPS